MITQIATRVGVWSAQCRKARLLRMKSTVDAAVGAALDKDDPAELEFCALRYSEIAQAAFEAGFFDVWTTARQGEATTNYELGSTHADAAALRRSINGLEVLLAENAAKLSREETANLLRLLGHAHAELGHLAQDAGALNRAISAYQESTKHAEGRDQGTMMRLTEQNIRLCRDAILSLQPTSRSD